MTQYFMQNLPRLYLTAPQPCPYLPGRLERKMFTQLGRESATGLNSLLTQSGFRRSQNIAYRPACETCSACISVRILAREFEPTRGFRRVRRVNEDLRRRLLPPRASEEQFALLSRYLAARHAEGGMADMGFHDYRAMVEETAVACHVAEYRLPPARPGERGRLVGAALTDTLEDGLSMAYSFFDAELAPRSLGTFMVLDHIAQALERRLPYVYLGYWVRGSHTMDYKARFQPLEALTALGWRRFETLRR